MFSEAHNDDPEFQQSWEQPDDQFGIGEAGDSDAGHDDNAEAEDVAQAAITAPDDYDRDPPPRLALPGFAEVDMNVGGKAPYINPVEIRGETTETTDAGFLGFRVRFDGAQPEVPLAEQKAAGARFSDFVGNDLAGVHSRSFQTEHDGQPVSVVTTDGLGDIDPTESKRVVVEEVRPDGAWGESAIYRLDIGGSVRRVDHIPYTDDQSARLAAHDLLPPADLRSMSTDQIRVYTSGLRSQLDTMHANHELAQNMGFTNQPVGMAEIEALIKLASRHS